MYLFEFFSSILSTFGLIFLAEIGDKSQLVCMTLAARYRHAPVMLGAVAAFLILNTLAVVFGAGLAQWIPDKIISVVVAIMFAFFGIKSLLTKEEELGQDGEAVGKFSHSIFVSTFMMLFFAEMGDKTQIAVAGLSVTFDPVAVWVGASIALITTSALGIWLGVTLLRKIPLHRLHQFSGVFFLGVAIFAAIQVF